MSKTVVGLFSHSDQARNAYNDLLAAGCARGDLNLLGPSAGGGELTGALDTLTRMGLPADDAKFYVDGVRKGATLLAAKTSDESATRAADILKKNCALEMPQRAAAPVATAAPIATAAPVATAAAAPIATAVAATAPKPVAPAPKPSAAPLRATDQFTIPVVEEELLVGKRDVERGTVRLSGRMIEEPVENKVRLREEHVHVERRPVDRAFSGAEWDSFREGSVEMTEKTEEAYVNKEVHVVEEVVLAKEVNERDETIRDTVRKTEVREESIAAPERTAPAVAVGPRAPLRPIEADGRTTMPIVEETIQVAKREFDRGGKRITGRIVQQPAEGKVKLREEHVTVERRPVDRTFAGAEWDSFQEGTVELTEHVEEPVVTKRSHVVEEVTLSKDSSEHEEIVRDKIHRTDVRVDDFHKPVDFREHFRSSAFARGGLSYEDVAPAYRYGYDVGSDRRLVGRDWKSLESDIRADWGRRNPKNVFEKIKDAIQHGFDRARSRA